MATRFDTLDTNGDGRSSEQEFMASPAVVVLPRASIGTATVSCRRKSSRQRPRRPAPPSADLDFWVRGQLGTVRRRSGTGRGGRGARSAPAHRSPWPEAPGRRGTVSIAGAADDAVQDALSACGATPPASIRRERRSPPGSTASSSTAASTFADNACAGPGRRSRMRSTCPPPTSPPIVRWTAQRRSRAPQPSSPNCQSASAWHSCSLGRRKDSRRHRRPARGIAALPNN